MKFKAWFGALRPGTKFVLIAVGVLIVVQGMNTISAIPAAFMSAVANSSQQNAPLTLVDNASVSTPAPAAPVETTANVTETGSVPYQAVSVNDGTMPAGTSAVTTFGVPGSVDRVYRVTYRDGIESAREFVSETVTVVPTDEVTSVGTYVAPPPPPPVASGCDSNYADACVPVSSDVDCAGGSGNGPAYVSGIVRVVGSDIYGLDRDGNGYGCD